MKVGLVGFAGSGKSTVFHWLTGVKPDPAKAMMGQSGNAKIPDPRLDWLSAKFHPKKTTPADLDFLDTQGVSSTERRDNPRRLGIFRVADGLLVVLNGFSEPDPAGQLRRFREELVFADLEIVSNRISKLQDQIKKPRPAKQKEQDEKELALLERINAALEQNVSPRDARPERGGREGDPQLPAPDAEAGATCWSTSARIGSASRCPPTCWPWRRPPSRRRPGSSWSWRTCPRRTRAFIKDFLGEGVDGTGARSGAADDLRGNGDAGVLHRGRGRVPGLGMPARGRCRPGAGQIHTDLAKAFVRAEVVSYARLPARWLDEGGQAAGGLPAGRQDLHRAGRRHHAHPGRGQVISGVTASLPRVAVGARQAVPIEFTDEDFDQAAEGQLVTKEVRL